MATRRPVQRFSEEPAYVLHRYDWSESSLILEVFTRHHGRIALVAKGAKRPSSSFRPILLPMQPLHIAFGGDGEIRTLKSAEWQGGHVMPKGDALGVARIAAIQATKRTAELIPLCHPIAIHGVDVDVQVVDPAGVEIHVTVRTADRTGVEMEALTAAAVGGLAIIDMVKGRDRSAAITEVVLLEKLGGRSGHWVRES
jgi:molybdenum cofactor biosynthesis protein MoaC